MVVVDVALEGMPEFKQSLPRLALWERTWHMTATQACKVIIHVVSHISCDPRKTFTAEYARNWPLPGRLSAVYGGFANRYR
jgi:hypothetical protein